MRVIIDSFENGTAVVLTDDGKKFSAPLSLFENGCEGDVFDIIFNKEETDNRREKIKNLMNEVWEK